MKKDIYYNVYYGKLYENTEHGKLETFEVDSEYGKIEHIFIKREIVYRKYLLKVGFNIKEELKCN